MAFKSDNWLSPAHFEPPTNTKGDAAAQRIWAAQWSRAIWFHWFKTLIIWSLFGILPYFIGVECTMTNLFWLDLVPWVVCGWYLGRKFLSAFEYHHMENLNTIAQLKFSGLFAWIYIYPGYGFTFWSMAVL